MCFNDVCFFVVDISLLKHRRIHSCLGCGFLYQRLKFCWKDQRAFRGLHPEALNGAFHIIPHCLVIFESIKINLFQIFNKIDAFPGSAFASFPHKNLANSALRTVWTTCAL